MTAISPTRLRQIALIAHDLERAKHVLTCVLGNQVVFEDPFVARWGLKNFLVPIGGDLIEVCSPFQPSTTVGRLLDKRGDGGYMLIMQTLDAEQRRRHIESHGLAQVIFDRSHDDVACVQYHPKDIFGGMMPELDSHTPSPANPTPLDSTYSPWHACGPDYDTYAGGMKQSSHLRLRRVTCRLAPGQHDTAAAARQWESLFGVAGRGHELAFTNARVAFVPGVEGGAAGLESITIEVSRLGHLDGILARAASEGLWRNGWVQMVGVKWYFVLPDDTPSEATMLDLRPHPSKL